MMKRREFLAGLGALTLASPAFAETKVNGHVIVEDKNKILRNVPDTPVDRIPNYRRYMRQMVQELGNAAHARDMEVLVRDAPELLTMERLEVDWYKIREPSAEHPAEGEQYVDYLNAIDGLIIDGLYVGHDAYGVPTDKPTAAPLHEAAEILRKTERQVFSIEYTQDDKLAAEITKKLEAAGITPFIDREGDLSLSSLPKGRPPHENPRHVTEMSEVKNWLPMMHADSFEDRDAWVEAMKHSSYDLLLLDPFCKGKPLTKAHVEALHYKSFGSRRLVFARLPVGLAFANRWYWKPEWKKAPPNYMRPADPADPNTWIVEYWNPDWKATLAQYFDGLVAQGYDGLLLDNVDAYILYEEEYPIE